MKRRAVIGSVILALLSAGLLVACGGGKEEATPTAETGAAAPAGAPAFAPVPGESGPPKEMIEKALQLVAEREGLSIEDLQVVAATTNEYPLLGTIAYGFKIADPSGELYVLTLGSDGSEVDAKSLLADEEAAYQDKYGNLEAALFDELKSAPPDEPINVTIWLQEPPYSPPPLPDLNKGLTAEQANAYLKLADQKRAEAVEKLTKPALDEINKMGLKAEADKYTPALQASLTPEEIDKAQQLKGLERIYLAPIFEPTLDVAREVVEAPYYGGDGSGVKVAEIEVGGQINTSNPNLSGVTQDTTSSCQHDHAAAVAGIIRSTDQTVHGIASGASLWIGGSCGGNTDQLKSRTNAAADWGATVFNNSWGYDGCSFLSDINKFEDDMVANRSRSVVFAAGNRGSDYYYGHCVTSPALAYNVVAVGASDDKNTVGWPDDTVADYSSYEDPTTTHNDREEPDVMAPGTNFQSTTNADPWTGNVGSGTSYAAPIVTGVIAQMMQETPALMIHPAAVRAILMATAAHNIEGDARLSDKDGAGQIDSHFARNVLQGLHGGQYMATSCGADSPGTSEYAISPIAGWPTRIALTWDVDPNYSSYSSEPSGDLDLQVINAAGQVVAQSTSFDNNYEIAYFTPATGEQYKIRVIRVRWDTPTTRNLAWAVWGDPTILPTPAPTTAGPSPTPKPTTAPVATLTRTPTPTRTLTPRPPTKTPTPGPSPTPKPPTKTPKPGTPRPTRGLPTPYM